MKFYASTVLFAGLTFAQSSSNSTTSSDPLKVYTISAANITASLIPYGARLTSLLVPSRSGAQVDVALGYDNATQYVVDSATNHTYFGPIVGRYANRIRNGTFTLNGATYQIPKNENGGANTLHGGSVGYDQRNWTVESFTENSISFSLLDNAFEGFPGRVWTLATYTVSSYASGPQGEVRPRLTCSTSSFALDEETPIMLANHIYWNLNGFQEETVLNDTTLWMPYNARYIETDGTLIPTGTIGTVASLAALDFTSPKLLGDAIGDPSAKGTCGTNCTGIDNAFIIDRPASSSLGQTVLGGGAEAPVLSMWSATTGIQLDVTTNQRGLQIYTCNGQNGTIPVKQSQQNRNNGTAGAAKFVEKYGCVVIETQALIDGINHPEWGVGLGVELFSPQTGPAVNWAAYDFSTF